MTKRFLVVMWMLLLAGCQSGGGWQRALPWNWWGGDDAAAVEQREAEVTAQEASIYRAAHEAAVRTEAALAAEVEPSRPVQVAQESATDTVHLLDAARGPLTLVEREAALALVRGLLSEERAAREVAERELAQKRGDAARLTVELERLGGELEAAREAASREAAANRALADRWRTRQAVLIGSTLGALGLAGLSLYVRYFGTSLTGPVGGALRTTVAALQRAREERPEAFEMVAPFLAKAQDEAHRQLVDRLTKGVVAR